MLFNFDASPIPVEFPAVAVVDGGLAISEQGGLIVRDSTISRRLKQEGIELLLGAALTSKKFLDELKRRCAEENSDLNKFLKEHFVYAVSTSRLNVDKEALELAEVTLRDDILDAEISRKNPLIIHKFAPVVASLKAKGKDFSTIFNTRNLLIDGRIPLVVLLAYIYVLNETMEYILNRSNGKKIIQPFLDLQWEFMVTHSLEASSYLFEQLLAIWEHFNGSDPHKGEPFFSYGLEAGLDQQHELLYYKPYHLGSGYVNSITRNADIFHNFFQWIDNNLIQDQQLLSLLGLLYGEDNIIFGGKSYRVREARLLKNEIESGELEGKSPIFKIQLINTETGEARDVLCKWTESRNAKHDLIATSVTQALGQLSYLVQIYGTYRFDFGQKEFSWEMIDYIPNSFLAYTGARDRFIAPGLSSILAGSEEQVSARLYDLGGIFAVEYLLGVRDCQMKHVLFAEAQKRLFRIDWEFMLDFVSEENKNIPSVLRGDEKQFLNLLSRQEKGGLYLGHIIKGFDDAISLAVQDVSQQHSQILGVVETNIPYSEFEAIKNNIVARLHGQVVDAIKQELGLINNIDAVSSPAASSPVANFTDSEKKLMQAMILAMEGDFKKAVNIMADPRSFEEQGFTLTAQMAQRYLSYYGPVKDDRGPTKFRSTRENLINYIADNVSQQLARDFATAMYSLRTKYDSIVDLAIKLKIKVFTRFRVLFKGQSEKITKYAGPIKVILSPNLPGSVTLWIYKLQDIPAGLPVNDGSLNPAAEYFIIKDGGAAGEMAGLWDADLPQYSGKKVVLGRHHPGRFTGLSGSYIFREHVTIYRRGDVIFIESNSDNGTFVAWAEEGKASADSTEGKEYPAKAALITRLQSIRERINSVTLHTSNGRKDLVLLNGRIVDQRLDEIQDIVMNGLIHDSIAPLEEELRNIEEETRRILDYFQRYSVIDYWQRLGLNSGASQVDIKRQFRKLMFEFHPDRYQNGDSRPHPISQAVAGQIARWLNEANDYLSSSPAVAASSPVQTTSDKGGIDFSALPITTQSVNSIANLKDSPLRGQSLSNVNLVTEWSQIQNMLQAGIIPSSERIKEYLEACCVKDSMDKEIDKVLACIADILRLEEERCQITESGLKELLVLLESDKPVKDMQRALINITILPKEPAIKP